MNYSRVSLMLSVSTLLLFTSCKKDDAPLFGQPATIKGNISAILALYDNGTAIDQFPGAGITQFNLAGTPLVENKPIAPVPNPNAFTTLPAIKDILKVVIN